MTTRKLLIAGLIGWLGCHAAVATADTIESVEKTLIERAEKITSLQFNVISTSDLEGEGYKAKHDTKGRYEYLKKGDKMLYRMESDGHSVTMQGGTEQTSKSKTTPWMLLAKSTT